MTRYNLQEGGQCLFWFAVSEEPGRESLVEMNEVLVTLQSRSKAERGQEVGEVFKMSRQSPRNPVPSVRLRLLKAPQLS